MKHTFSGKNVMVTGGSRGIGKRLAIGFFQRGARIALVGRSKAELDLAHIEIEQSGGNALRLRADVTDPEQLAVAVDRVRVTFGRSVDILICAAAIPGPLHSFAQATLKNWTEAVCINLLGVVHSCRAVLPSMLEHRSGKIIVLGCYSDSVPAHGFSAYTTSKQALIPFVESLASEVAAHNIQVNCFDPGEAYTTFTDEVIRASGRLEVDVVQRALKVRQTGGTSPEAQVEMAAFLASEASNHITGKILTVKDDWRKLKNATLRPEQYTLRRLVK
jgi:NAD(P)-dependent dehydrogenase (short-subunit alcohol dehydrogenase family)